MDGGADDPVAGAGDVSLIEPARRHPLRTTGGGRNVEEQGLSDLFLGGDGLLPSQADQNNLLQNPSPSFLSFSFFRTSTFDMSS